MSRDAAELRQLARLVHRELTLQGSLRDVAEIYVWGLEEALLTAEVAWTGASADDALPVARHERGRETAAALRVSGGGAGGSWSTSWRNSKSSRTEAVAFALTQPPRSPTGKPVSEARNPRI